MDVFLAVACPEIGIADRDVYLSTFGWELVQNGTSWELIRHNIPHQGSFPAGFFSTMLSAEDMVKIARDRGYGIPSQTSAVTNDLSGAYLTMATQPALQVAHPVPQAAHSAHQTAQYSLQHVQQATQNAQVSYQAAQPAPQAAQPAVQTAQVTQLNQNPYTSGTSTLDDHIMLSDQNDPNSVISLLDFLDPAPEHITLERKNHGDPFLFEHSINTQVTSGHDTRAYYPASPPSAGAYMDNASVDKSDPSKCGRNGYAALATELWDSGSKWPHNDQFIPGQNYPTIHNSTYLNDFDAFDMNDLTNWSEK